MSERRMLSYWNCEKSLIKILLCNYFVYRLKCIYNKSSAYQDSLVDIRSLLFVVWCWSVAFCFLNLHTVWIQSFSGTIHDDRFHWMLASQVRPSPFCQLWPQHVNIQMPVVDYKIMFVVFKGENGWIWDYSSLRGGVEWPPWTWRTVRKLLSAAHVSDV